MKHSQEKDIAAAQEVLLTEAQALEQAAEKLGESLTQAIEMILGTRGKLIITGVGKSGLVASKAATFASTGTPSFFLHPTEAMHGDLGMISPEDTVLAISNSGESEELIRILPHLQRLQIPLIGMSAKQETTLGRYAQVWLDISVEKEACPLGVAPTSSTTVTMALGDALAVCLMHRRGFKKEDFASFHPGGSLGKQLFVKAMDLARTENLPMVGIDATVAEAIAEMTRGKMGTVLIVEEGKLAGILSDGDLRRGLMGEGFSLEKPALEYATRNPATCDDPDLLASEALELIEERKIQVLILKSGERIGGVLHIHDLVEAGIR